MVDYIHRADNYLHLNNDYIHTHKLYTVHINQTLYNVRQSVAQAQHAYAYISKNPPPEISGRTQKERGEQTLVIVVQD